MFNNTWRRRLETIRTWATLLTMCFLIGFIMVLISGAPAEPKRIVTVWGHQAAMRN